MSAQIRLAISQADRNAVYQFRYEVYVKEMRRIQKYANHKLGVVEEPLDRTGYVLIAEEAGHVVGTARFNVGVDENFGLYEELYQLRAFEPFYPFSLSVTTKLMVAPEYRRSLLPRQLSVCCYVHGLRLGTAFDFIDCNAPLVPFFSKLGYRQVFPAVPHPEYGNVVPMVLAMYDRDYLKHVGSPFTRHACNAIDRKGSVAFFQDRFSSVAKRGSGDRIVNGQELAIGS